MSETFAATYAKAIDDLAGKIFMPGLIASCMVELGPWLRANENMRFIGTYLICVIMGLVLSALFFLLIGFASIYLFNGEDAAKIIGIVIMPLGFAGLFPEQFINFTVPYSQVTSVAILAWSFMLIRFDLLKIS